MLREEYGDKINWHCLVEYEELRTITIESIYGKLKQWEYQRSDEKIFYVVLALNDENFDEKLTKALQECSDFCKESNLAIKNTEKTQKYVMEKVKNICKSITWEK